MFYNLDFVFFINSRSSLRKIFPLGLFGISVTNITPPCNRLAGDVLSKKKKP